MASLEEEEKDILLLNLLYESKLFTELNKDNIVTILLNSKKENLLEKTLFVSYIMKVKQKNDMKLIAKILNNMDEVCILYGKIRYGERTTSTDFDIMINPIISIIKSDKCNLISDNGDHLLSILISYYIDNPILQDNSHIGSSYSLEYIIGLLLNNANLDISYEELNKSLTLILCETNDELYNEIKEKVMKLNRKRLDKSVYTFWDFYDDIEELLSLFDDIYDDEDTLKFVNQYNKIVELIKTKKCDLIKDNMIEHFSDLFGIIEYEGTEYSIKTLISLFNEQTK